MNYNITLNQENFYLVANEVISKGHFVKYTNLALNFMKLCLTQDGNFSGLDKHTQERISAILLTVFHNNPSFISQPLNSTKEHLIKKNNILAEEFLNSLSKDNISYLFNLLNEGKSANGLNLFNNQIKKTNIKNNFSNQDMINHYFKSKFKLEANKPYSNDYRFNNLDLILNTINVAPQLSLLKEIDFVNQFMTVIEKEQKSPWAIHFLTKLSLKYNVFIFNELNKEQKESFIQLYFLNILINKKTNIEKQNLGEKSLTFTNLYKFMKVNHVTNDFINESLIKMTKNHHNYFQNTILMNEDTSFLEDITKNNIYLINYIYNFREQFKKNYKEIISENTLTSYMSNIVKTNYIFIENLILSNNINVNNHIEKQSNINRIKL